MVTSPSSMSLTLPPPLPSSGVKEKKMEKRQKKSSSKSSKGKGKERAENQDGDVDVVQQADEDSDFKLVRAVMKLPLAPVFAEDPLEGVRQCLESWIMRYIPAIDAVLLSLSWPPEFLEDHAPLVQSSAFTLAQVRWEGVGFRPQIGKQSTGKLSLATPSIVSLLLHNLFNASISAEHIPTDTYEWDPEAILPYSLAPPPVQKETPDVVGAKDETAEGEGADDDGAQEEKEEQQDDDEEAAAPQEEIEAERGCWVHKVTREPLGGRDGRISFTVIGLTIANSMISVHGSLLPDPEAHIKQKKRQERRQWREEEAAAAAKAAGRLGNHATAAKRKRD